MLYENLKTGKLYIHLAAGIDCTNSRDGIPVVIYCPDDNEHIIFVREENEFYQKFKIVELPRTF